MLLEIPENTWAVTLPYYTAINTNIIVNTSTLAPYYINITIINIIVIGQVHHVLRIIPRLRSDHGVR